MTKAVARQYFLSRLCGGESLTESLAAQPTFLSRLCGGEFVWAINGL